MKLISYNLNGVRAALAKGFDQWLQQEQPDIICLQEIKAQADQIPLSIFIEMGYTCFLNPAQKKGYSGTAIFTKVKPDAVSYGFGIEEYDVEGRLIRADFGDKTLICSYFPSGTTGEVRQAFKMKYLEDFTRYIQDLRKQRPELIICGDFNICHKPIDINFPKKHETISGFLPEERAWFDDFVALGYVDTFREFCAADERYSWWSYRSGARPKNLGWRIDYFLVTENLRSTLLDADILDKVVHSDHCPVELKVYKAIR
ncbi:MAG: exodeoxyribonuclease III [Prevotellaceae bacterium]|nr:exodeoxyribonuclease III [Prevotellaceae bacterium]